MRDWNELVNQLQQRWKSSRKEVCKQLIVTLRYAVFDPLNSVRVASNILEDDVKSTVVQNWMRDCNQHCEHWIENYWRIQAHCQNSLDDDEEICKCILQEIEILFADGIELHSQGFQLLNQYEKEVDRTGKILLHNLAVVAQIYKKLQSQDFSWLWRYIEQEAQTRR